MPLANERVLQSCDSLGCPTKPTAMVLLVIGLSCLLFNRYLLDNSYIVSQQGSVFFATEALFHIASEPIDPIVDFNVSTLERVYHQGSTCRIQERVYVSARERHNLKVAVIGGSVPLRSINRVLWATHVSRLVDVKLNLGKQRRRLSWNETRLRCGREDHVFVKHFISATCSVPTGIRDEWSQPFLHFLSERRLLDRASNGDHLVEPKRLHPELIRGARTVFCLQPTFPVAYGVRHDVHDVFFAIRCVDVVLRELVGAEYVGRLPRFLVPSKELIRVSFPMARHIIQHDDGFKPSKFVHHPNNRCPERAVVVAPATVRHEH
mmetsp:Transcript_5641/g.22168  ORF Transcript_5641/g.22168 Transcript_5641/m.22168 type:complete len:321 (-) Transcript_5641:1779-2741(-)